jgi:uncharacterized damage-inducible protein DinB
MDKAALEDLFAYTGWVWDQVRATVPADETLVTVAPGSSWPDLRNCLAHIILAYDRWVPAIVELRTRPVPELPDNDFRTWAQVGAQRERTRTSLHEAIDHWPDSNLQQMHDVDIDGSAIRYSRAELILHLLLHERGHHGDITTLFWQLGIELDTPLEYRFHLARK